MQLWREGPRKQMKAQAVERADWVLVPLLSLTKLGTWALTKLLLSLLSLPVTWGIQASISYDYCEG